MTIGLIRIRRRLTTKGKYCLLISNLSCSWLSLVQLTIVFGYGLTTNCWFTKSSLMKGCSIQFGLTILNFLWHINTNCSTCELCLGILRNRMWNWGIRASYKRKRILDCNSNKYAVLWKNMRGYSSQLTIYLRVTAKRCHLIVATQGIVFPKELAA